MLRLAVCTHKRRDAGAHPIQVTAFGAVAHLAMPGPAGGQGAVHLPEETLGVGAGVEHGVVLPEQLFPRVAAHLAKLVVHRQNAPLHIGSGHNGVLVERVQGLGQLPVEAHIGIGQGLCRPLAGRSVG